MYNKYNSSQKPLRKAIFDHVKEENSSSSEIDSSDRYQRASVFTSPYKNGKRRRHDKGDRTGEKLRKSTVPKLPDINKKKYKEEVASPEDSSLGWA